MWCVCGACGRVRRLKKLAAREVTNMYMCSAICVLHLAEPELGVKAIVRRLGPQHPSVATLALCVMSYKVHSTMGWGVGGC